MRAAARGPHRLFGRVLPGAALAAILGATGLAGVGAAHSDDDDDATSLHLVTLRGPGTTGHRGPASPEVVAQRMLAQQSAVLDAVHATDPVYQWTTALNGFAVELSEEQHDALVGDDRVALVEENAVRPLADVADSPAGAAALPPRDRGGSGGAGTVIGFVDTGIDPASPAFSQVDALGRTPHRFAGSCADAPDDPDWDETDCSDKIVGAQFYVDGFGVDELRTTAALSPRDTYGHGTEAASVAAGIGHAPARSGRHRLGRFSGVAPQARIAVYKACWSAPDPADDGCATADLVAAIDQAARDRVDVLNLSVGGPSGTIDTVERALLGATEAGVVVTAAAGNDGSTAYAAHPSPWVVTVGASTSAPRVGAVVATHGPRLEGAMVATAPVAPAPLVLGADAAAAGVGEADARVCAPGSLDARAVHDAIVLCERGSVPRVDKSQTVRLADGAGMVLVNTEAGSTDADLHAVPTVHLSAREGRTLRAWAADRRRPEVRLVALGRERTPTRVARFSSGGDPTWSVIKPDLVAPGTSVLAATTGGGWDVVSGTSVATAHVSGVAAILLGRPGSTPAEVRSALLTSTAPIGRHSGLRAGTGEVRISRVPPMGYLVDPRHYRGWLVGRRADLDLPQALMRTGRLAVRRTITNTGRRPLWLTTRLLGFDSPVLVSPSAGLLRPGRTLTFRISLPTAPRTTDTGTVLWRTYAGDETRLAVVITR
ncbi:S8 family serine peptidase [Nocardioides bizhenqiangii]|uniref:S8 family serine peptidase n=1 Tax=Nocardioides bizhenqiangii TaxID=3095076 RepID=A0ABZ0ZPT3_9ACTN|nr:S8 family serine peptidase [Nocardioides sp. HM61]WQQ25834.1 S8 family serine peptidase [Nocardioides sp. HM61]